MAIKYRSDKKFNSAIEEGLTAEADYMDSFHIGIGDNRYSIDYLTALIFSSFYQFRWMKALFRLRNFLVKPFGLVTDDIPALREADPSVRYKKGDIAVFFHVINRSDHEIVMGDDDKHLYFRVSLLSYDDPERKERVLYLTTLVQFHNAMGRIYFTVIKQFHKIIMIMLLRNLSGRLKKVKKH